MTSWPPIGLSVLLGSIPGCVGSAHGAGLVAQQARGAGLSLLCQHASLNPVAVAAAEMQLI
eukprot:CAMPEP_0202888296 /NCGR_PEP_ID=MMETSP1391-20130828/43118_1 /ASSEMBLY_ACC=CAM_ASM_000867 /TAXON_ID=1034604 /ORGANISM="Chlamydomonas leiostraca, Strain SAG 11-49" /LENGTH=60 /DNA_ID=CAMNT_0049571597 /DNA_START=596 /DNA_END=778 /DNA_ORIENTATION=-